MMKFDSRSLVCLYLLSLITPCLVVACHVYAMFIDHEGEIDI